MSAFSSDIGTFKSSEPSIKEVNGITSIHTGCYDKQTNEEIIYSIDSETLDEINNDINELLYFYVLLNNPESINNLLMQGADPLYTSELLTSEGWCALSEAIRLERNDILMIFIKSNISSKEAKIAGISLRAAMVFWAATHEKNDLFIGFANDLTIDEIVQTDRYMTLLQSRHLHHSKLKNYKFEGQGLRYIVGHNEKLMKCVGTLIEKVKKMSGDKSEGDKKESLPK